MSPPFSVDFERVTSVFAARVSLCNHIMVNCLGNYPIWTHLFQRMAAYLRAYNAALLRRPLLAQCCTAVALFGAGDVIAQQVIEKKGANHDVMRTARLTFYGGAMFAPVLTKWYQLLNRLTFSTPTKTVIYRVWLDQTLFSPVAVVLFFGSMSLLDGKGIGEAQHRISTAYVPTLVRSWAVFVPAQIVNFAVVPHQLRFVFVGVVSLFWNTYLSAVNAKAGSD